MFSIFDGTTWSTPQLVLDDGTADFEPVICSDGNGRAHILWQNATEMFNTGVTLEEMSAAVDLQYTHWNGSSFDSTSAITKNNTNLETAPKIAALGNNISVVWEQNSENDPMGLSGTNSIYRKQFSDGIWENTETLALGLQVITSMDTAYAGSDNIVAYTTKSSNDLSTVNDLEVFYFDGTQTLRITDDDIPDNSVSLLNNENSAIDIYGQAHSLIVRTKMSIPYADYDTKNANYCIYTLAAGGTYSVAIYVENTAVYAYSNEENAGAISDILEAIGYFKNNPNNNTVNTAEKRNTGNEMALFRIVYFFLLLIVHRVSLFWLWAEVRRVAGVTKQEIKEYRIDNRRVINPQKKFYFWLLSRSQNPKKFKRLFMTYQICILPSILCFVFAVLGCFTPVFDNALGNMGVIMSGLPIVFAFSAVLYNTFSKKS